MFAIGSARSPAKGDLSLFEQVIQKDFFAAAKGRVILLLDDQNRGQGEKTGGGEVKKLFPFRGLKQADIAYLFFRLEAVDMAGKIGSNFLMRVFRQVFFEDVSNHILVALAFLIPLQNKERRGIGLHPGYRVHGLGRACQPKGKEKN